MGAAAAPAAVVEATDAPPGFEAEVEVEVAEEGVEPEPAAFEADAEAECRREAGSEESTSE
jgi:hypothetical protein